MIKPLPSNHDLFLNVTIQQCNNWVIGSHLSYAPDYNLGCKVSIYIEMFNIKLCLATWLPIQYLLYQWFLQYRMPDIVESKHNSIK